MILFVNKFFTKSMILSLVVCLLIMPIAQTKKVEAANSIQKLIYSAAAVALITAYYNNVNDKGQEDSLASTQKKTGVYDNEETRQRIHYIENRLKSPGLINANYQIYANPKKEFNAFCTLGHVISINKGALENLDDDELAVIMGHEMAHGEENHIVAGITKSISLGFAVDIFLSNNQNSTISTLSAIGTNYINNEMFTMQQEWEADNLSFTYTTAAGFNPGAPAATMVKMRSMYGELYQEGLAKITKPNNHPKTSDRINNFAAKLTTYSHNHIIVKNDKTILIDNQELITPVKTSTYLAEERAYLIAGNLAKVYHNNKGIDTAVIGEDGAVYIGNQKISDMVDNDISADEFATRINLINSKRL